jgi:phosphoribosyl 1,2-cyclic phosphodiesterase
MVCLFFSGSSTTRHSSGSPRLGAVFDLISYNIRSLFGCKVGHAKCSLLLFSLRTIDGVIITHSHADAIGGL